VSAGLSGAPQPGGAPISRPRLLLPWTATAFCFPFDAVLAGMVAAGQGIHAICLYLRLTRAALDEHLVRLGLRTPHERPLRKSGPRGWSLLDTIRLIAWRVAGIHPRRSHSVSAGRRMRSAPRHVGSAFRDPTARRCKGSIRRT
jgi:hypothetical protein